MNNLDKNWNNLFGEYTTDETAWYGRWTVYSPTQEVLSTKQAVRSFRSNLDNTVITHINRYVDANGNVEEKIWQIDRATCNQPDGVVHPAMPFMRALSFGEGATAWIAPKFVPGKPFGGEFFFKDDKWRTSAVIVYGENGQIDRIVHIREQIGGFSDESVSDESSDDLGDWIGNQRTMTSDLSISPEEKIQLSFNQGGDSEALLRSPLALPKASAERKMILLPKGLVLMLPERVTINQPIQIAAAQRTAEHQLKYLAAHYTAVGAFTLLISATLQQKI
ncbi:DUF3598 family protein [Chroococcidiopsis sp. CCMEE 29]|uniref:DUF3598 family protein n=1 Tax=Chroococcidiopsis sp. CCMEE 29 TaxID=155894 RepID=UPI00201FC5BF|nr:DUF3598 family protein [Chroococcidiopsis sp. CCMEE 29]